MSKLMFSAAAFATLASGLILPEAPALAQKATPGEIVVYGTDPCPRTTDDLIVVCRRRPEAERFRIPEKLRQSGSRQARQAWTRQAEVLANAGATGIGTCSPVGPGGSTGCARREIARGFNERGEQDKGDSAPTK